MRRLSRISRMGGIVKWVENRMARIDIYDCYRWVARMNRISIGWEEWEGWIGLVDQ